jgi:hypothetical protein
MPNSAIDRQFYLALRDQEKAEKFAEHIAELTTEIINASLKFSQATKSAYESELIPKRRGGDKNFDEADQPSWRWVLSASLCIFSTDVSSISRPRL